MQNLFRNRPRWSRGDRGHEKFRKPLRRPEIGQMPDHIKSRIAIAVLNGLFSAHPDKVVINLPTRLRTG